MKAAEIEEAAARWLIQREEPDWSPEHAAALADWLAADARHKTAFWRLEYAWGEADRLAALGPSRPPARAPVIRMRWIVAAAGLAACLLIAVVAALNTPGLAGSPKAFETAVGGREVVPLADGSRIELNTATRLRAAVTSRQREVWLDQGEAYFDIAHDAAHPFVVHAGPRRITVLGTRFSVLRTGDQVRVAVVEGRVRVEEAQRAIARQAPPVVTPGQMAIADGASTLVAVSTPQSISNSLSWRQGRLAFDQSPLSDVAAQFNRYNVKQIVVADPGVGRIPIGGSFEAQNVEAFARLLERGFGLKVDDDGQTLRISN